MSWGRLEKNSNVTRLHIDADMYNSMSENYNQCLLENKKTYNTNTVLDCAKDQRALFNLINKLLHKTSFLLLPFSSISTQLANDFPNFFEGKIIEIPPPVRS